MIEIHTGSSENEPRQEFHIRGAIRRETGVDSRLFSIAGTLVTTDVRQTRELAYKLSRYRRAHGHPNPDVRTGDIVALGLLDEIFHHMLDLYRSETGDTLLSDAMREVSASVGSDEVEATIRRFCEEFPPTSVFKGEKSLDDYLDESVEGLTGRERSLEELVLLRITNENPAAARYKDLFDDTELEAGSRYRQVFAGIETYLSGKSAAGFGSEGQSILDLLRSPARAHPHSLEEQLSYVRDRWGAYVGRFLTRLLRSMDVLKEESKVGAPPGGGPGPAEVYQYDESDAERFSQDTEWMPGVVLIAKSTLVWLYQLSQRYNREIKRLDQVPDEELDTLASSGFNALWLIGLWERSSASRRIKHLMGNPEAEASAYALFSYDIAAEIGGWEAYGNLHRRCGDRGIRLASDMVPNHTGIDSPWVAEHPEWFIHLDYPPFPAYSFSGENLSGRDNVGVYLEDHYFTKDDASVVFKHVDSGGKERYIYHGNDGTSMPWNDTAQLNYLDPEVRETVIQTILHVARNFPIIRFDAAMTLAKKHFRRLWYPEPGSGGDIASRGEHGLPRDDFDRAMPVEFWREVVDRVAQEAPGTLLLAEAFWMMEGYFVRTLGMHRVYNSAFMNMLKRENNADYRAIIKETLAFDPDILGRFVNFMNNPDEETAVTQFGADDKYFGVCTLLATLPGLPMFGHGQVEGLAEKYGMEFRRPYWDEHPNEGLMQRHGWEIFPLLRRRTIFASSAAFRLYDFQADGGGTNENVYAYSNGAGDEKAVVVFNNSFEQTAGRINGSVPYVVKKGDGGREERTESLASAMGLSRDSNAYCLFREQKSGLWFIRGARNLHDSGLYVSLDGYQTSVFLDVHQRFDTAEGDLSRLERELAGAGVANIDHALLGLELRPARDAFAQTVTQERLVVFEKAQQGHESFEESQFAEIRSGYRRFLDSLAGYRAPTRPIGIGITALERYLSTVVSLPHMDVGEDVAVRRALGRYMTGLKERPDRRRFLSAWTVLAPVVELYGGAAMPLTEWGIDSWLDFADLKEPERCRALLRSALQFEEPTAIDPAATAATEGKAPQAPKKSAAANSARVSKPSETDVQFILDQLFKHDQTGVQTSEEYYQEDRLSDLLWAYFVVTLVRTVSSTPLGGRTATERIRRLTAATAEVEKRATGAAGRIDELRSPAPKKAPKKASAKSTPKKKAPTKKADSKKGGKKADSDR